MGASIHGTIAGALLLYMLILGLWGLLAFARGTGVTPGYRGSLVIGEGLAVVQALAGAGLVLTGARSHDSLHYLYGVLTPLILPLMYGYARGQPSRRAALFYGIAAFFAFGLIIRAFMTGG